MRSTASVVIPAERKARVPESITAAITEFVRAVVMDSGTPLRGVSNDGRV
jgi:hypothetical protein